MSDPTGLGTARPKNVQLSLTVNGEKKDVSFAPYKTLLEVLREDLGLTGTKHGCELGECGACAVLVDDRNRVQGSGRGSQAEYDANEEGLEQCLLLNDSPAESGTCGRV